MKLLFHGVYYPIGVNGKCSDKQVQNEIFTYVIKRQNAAYGRRLIAILYQNNANDNCWDNGPLKRSRGTRERVHSLETIIACGDAQTFIHVQEC